MQHGNWRRKECGKILRGDKNYVRKTAYTAPPVLLANAVFFKGVNKWQKN